jgi:hypothetical protein
VSRSDSMSTVEAPLPPGFSLEQGDELLTIVSRVSDPGEAFSLAMIGLVVLGLSFGLGARIGGSTGALVGGAVGLPVWGALLGAALGRIVNTTKLLVSKGKVVELTSPIALRRRREFDGVTGCALRGATHTSSTRGSMAALKITTWALWLTRAGKPDHCVLFELPDEQGAKRLHAAMQRALTAR